MGRRRRTQWRALGLAVGLAAAGAVAAYLLAGGRWAAAGAVIGAVTGGFAPSVYDGLRGRSAGRDAWQGTVENPPPRSWARLLDPRREVVGFVGRTDELNALVAWCEDNRSGRLRLVTGPGGVGKTRLAVELADRMRRAGWQTERVADGKEAGALSALREVTGGRALLVVDYAETRSGLGRLVSELAGELGDGVRVLLLARSAGEWLDQLGIGDPAAWDQVQAARAALIDLPAVVAADLSDAEVIALAVRSFAGELGVLEKSVEIHGGTGQRRVLDLHAAALIAVLGDASTRTAQVDIGQVLDELLRHEQHFWYDSARASGLGHGRAGTTTKVLRQVVAAACLLGAATEDEARTLAGRAPGMSPSAKIAEWLRALYPPELGGKEWIGSLQPDRLAELHSLRELTASPQLTRACLTGMDARQALRAVMLLARACSEYPQAEELLRQTLPSVADVIAGMQAPAETLMVIVNAIPVPTVALAPVAATICRRVVSLLPASADPAVRAYWLSHLGVRISELGRPAEALTVEREAVAIRRELAAASPDRYRPILAQSLNNLGIWFFELGRAAEALSAAEEAVAIYREQAAASPDRYRPILAQSLSNLGAMFLDLGRPAEALPIVGEAVAIYREQAAASPERYRPYLANSLSNLGICFAELGRPAEALPIVEQAVAIRRELAAANPDRYRPDLASCLTNLGSTFSKLGHLADALTIEQEAVTIRRELAAASPDRYRPDLARSLANLGKTYAELGRLAEALPIVEETVAIRRELAAASPDRYRPALVRSLTDLSDVLDALGREADGSTARQQAEEFRMQRDQ
jgi:tetratricopeptide (TPR) repeat protein